MRVWDIPVHQLCNKHLIAQHHEIHCIYSIITKGLKGFAHHPEVMRWRDNLGGLQQAHNATAKRMLARGFNHYSPMDIEEPTTFITEWQTVEEQIRLLREKGCDCNV